MNPSLATPKPFLKWAGGKSQLLAAIQAALPADLHTWKKCTYIEPFVGSGAVLFWILAKYPNIERAVINDVNPDLTMAYHTIRNKPQELIAQLTAIQDAYYALDSEERRKEYYLEQRHTFNRRALDPVSLTSLLIFLNRTCFNGLYRVNSRGGFNVPFGRYSNPRICDSDTILADSAVLQKVTILQGDFEETINYAGLNTLVYLDPPYKPISATASFNAYASNGFGDAEQERLRQFCDMLSAKGAHWLLSNSDPKNIDPANSYFDDLYAGYAIERVRARRNINSSGGKRGEISELLIRNYEVDSGCILKSFRTPATL